MGREEERGGRRRRLEKEARPGRCGEGLAAACASGLAGPWAVERRDEAGPAWLERGQLVETARPSRLYLPGPSPAGKTEQRTNSMRRSALGAPRVGAGLWL